MNKKEIRDRVNKLTEEELVKRYNELIAKLNILSESKEVSDDEWNEAEFECGFCRHQYVHKFKHNLNTGD